MLISYNFISTYNNAQALLLNLPFHVSTKFGLSVCYFLKSNLQCIGNCLPYLQPLRLALSAAIKACPKNTSWVWLLTTTLLFSILIFYPVLYEICRFFLPLVISTAICSTAMYWFILSGNGGIVLHFEGHNGEDLVGDQVFDNVVFCIGTHDVEILNAPMSGFDGGERNHLGKVVLTNVKLEAVKDREGDHEEVSSCVDTLAETVWNAYFGRYSNWNSRKKWKDVGMLYGGQENR